MALTFGSLFAGIGGFDLGLDRNGMVGEFQVEQDENCNQILSKQWPHLERHLDVSEFNKTTTTFRPDLICGGFPCQDVSVAGQRKGLAGERSGLFYEFARIIDELSPRWVLIENVRGLLSSNGWRDMGAVVGTLGDMGYGWAYRMLDSQWFGVAQRRKRVFIVGCIGNATSAAEVLFEPESVPWDSPPCREAGERVAASLTSGVAAGSGVNAPGRRREDDVNIVVGSLQSHSKRHGHAMTTQQAAESGHLVHCEDISRALTSCKTATGRLNPNEQEFIAFDERNITSPHNRSNPGPGDPCHTLHSDAPRLASPMSVRRLTPRECERLQGFPDDWTRWGPGEKEISDSARYRMLGNAVTVNVAEWIGKRIVEHETCA